ncbi:MAG: Panacea domain-containing protein [Methanobacteriaceae archaeon]|nr:Panacea domain-containing protein [Methanobacteriaceae archaeon]
MVGDKFNIEKFKVVLHYIIDKCGCQVNVGRILVYKLLYFSDFNFFELYEYSLTSETYIKFPEGPVPFHFEDSIKELINEEKVFEKSEPFLDNKKYFYSSLKKPDTSILMCKEIEVIDNVIFGLSSMSVAQFSDYFFGDMPWKATEDFEPIDYAFVFYRDPEYTVRIYDE